MKFIVKKDKVARNKFLLREPKLNALKAIFNNLYLPIVIRQRAANEIYRLNKDLGFFVRVKNRCYQTGRGGSVDRKFHVSRLKLRELAHFGMLQGIKKSSW